MVKHPRAPAAHPRPGDAAPLLRHHPAPAPCTAKRLLFLQDNLEGDTLVELGILVFGERGNRLQIGYGVG